MTALDRLIAAYTFVSPRPDVSPDYRVCARLPDGKLQPVGTVEEARRVILEAAGVTEDKPRYRWKAERGETVTHVVLEMGPRGMWIIGADNE